MAATSRQMMAALLGGLLACAGCGTFTARPTELANPETGDNGEPLDLDAIRDVTTDTNLTDLEKRDALRDMGIVDEDLVDALITITQ